MQELIDFVTTHTVRGACQCGSCFDAPPNPKAHQPAGHTADLIFWKVAAVGSPTAVELKRLIENNREGEWASVDLFDGKDHSFSELGAWIGSQDLALRLMGLGSLLNLWQLLTPRLLDPAMPEELAIRMAQAGYLSIMAKES